MNNNEKIVFGKTSKNFFNLVLKKPYQKKFW